MLVLNSSFDRMSLISYTEWPDFLSEMILSCMKSEACLLLGPYCGFKKNSTFLFWKLLTRDWNVDVEYPPFLQLLFELMIPENMLLELHIVSVQVLLDF